jgi:hemolysin activation/secretion protein
LIMNKLKSLSLFLLVSTFPLVSYSQVPTSAEPQQIEKRFDNLAPRTISQPTIEAPADEEGKGESKTKIFKLNSVQFEGNTVFSNEELSSMAAEYKGKQVSLFDLRNIARNITKKYRDAGYILSKAVLSPQKIKDGVVKIQVMEGFISEVTFSGKVSGDGKIIKNFAEKIKSLRPINKADLERYLLLADDLPGVTARSVIRASSTTPGASELIINLEDKKQEYSVSADNYGSRFVGPYQLTGVAAFNSLFGMFDRTTFRTVNATQSDELFFYDILHEEQVFSEGTKLKVRFANSESQPGGRIQSLDIEGDSKTIEANLEHPFIRSRTTNLTGRTGFKTNDSRTNISGILQSNDRVRSWANGITLDFEDGLNSSNSISFDMTTGFDILGATEDGVGRSRSNGEHEFNKFNAEIIRLQKITDNISLFTSAAGQFSNDPLLSSEEASFGGRRYGRGYDPAEISGDKGAAGLAELRFNSDYQNVYVKNVQYYTFYDVAGVWNENILAGEQSKQTLASAGAGVRFNLKYDLTGDLSIAAPLTREVNAESNSGDEPRIFFSINKRF